MVDKGSQLLTPVHSSKTEFPRSTGTNRIFSGDKRGMEGTPCMFRVLDVEISGTVEIDIDDRAVDISMKGSHRYGT